MPLLTCTLLVGCSDSKDLPANQTSAPAPNSEAPTILTTFDGSYLAPCEFSDEENPGEGFEMVSTTISGDAGTFRIFNYTDAACTTPDSPAEILIDVSFAYPGNTVQTALGTADFVNVTPEIITIDGQMPTTEQLQQLSQSGAFDTVFDILLLDGSSLFGGDTSGDLNGESEVTRPDTLSSDSTIRQ